MDSIRSMVHISVYNCVFHLYVPFNLDAFIIFGKRSYFIQTSSCITISFFYKFKCVQPIIKSVFIHISPQFIYSYCHFSCYIISISDVINLVLMEVCSKYHSLFLVLLDWAVWIRNMFKYVLILVLVEVSL